MGVLGTIVGLALFNFVFLGVVWYAVRPRGVRGVLVLCTVLALVTITAGWLWPLVAVFALGRAVVDFA